MPCHDVGKRLQRYLDDEVDDERLARRVAEHLEDGRRCGLEAEAYREIKAALARQASILPDTTLHRLRCFGHQLANHSHPPQSHNNGNGQGRPDDRP